MESGFTCPSLKAENLVEIGYKRTFLASGIKFKKKLAFPVSI